MRPAVATVCSLDAALPTILEDYAAGHCDAVDLWLGHAEAALESQSVEQLSDLFTSTGIAPVAASFQGGLLTSQGDARQEHWSLFEKRLPLLSQLKIPVLVVAGDAFGPLLPQDLSRLSMSLSEAGKRAADAGALVEDVGHPAVGLCLDWYHYTVGPSKANDLWLLSPDILFHVQLSDIADVPREMASDADRILPGEGSSPPDPLLTRLRELQYTGAISVETHNPQLWRVPPRQFGEIAITALRRLLGDARME